jgi:adenine phosphoribosyltransferase
VPRARDPPSITADTVGKAVIRTHPDIIALPVRVVRQDRLMPTSPRSALLEHFRWCAGHADLWAVFADPDAFAVVVAGLIEPWRDQRVTRVLGIEARGFLLGGAAALLLGIGFVGVRKASGLLPGARIEVDTDEGYRGQRHRLRMQPVLGADDRVLLVDDWAERSSQARAARQLVQLCGAAFLGASVLVDQLTTEARSALVRVTSLARADELD